MESLLQQVRSCIQVRGWSPLTEEAYLRHVRKFSEHFGRCPSELGAEHAERYLLHLAQARKLSSSTRNQCAAALRFLYTVVLRRPEQAAWIPNTKSKKRLGAVLSGTEVVKVLRSLSNRRHRTLALLCYGAGLRVREACRLQIDDIDTRRSVLLIRDAKGQKDRQVTLSPRLLKALRAYYKQYRPAGPYLFEGRGSGRPLSAAAFQIALRKAAQRAGIPKRVTPHVLRHSYATHMVEAGADLRSVQLLLGHNSLRSTVRYVHLSHARQKALPSPLDMLGTEPGAALG